MKICDTYLKKGSLLFHKKIELIKSGMSPEEASKCLYAFCPSKTSYYYAINIVKIPNSNVFLYDNSVGEYIEWLGKVCEERMLKGTFDMVIQNPPYEGGGHLLFLKQGLEMLNKTGKMSIIEPATWLINMRKNGKAGLYDEIKEKINGHVESVIIENLNKDFHTLLRMPFSITTIDKSQRFDSIKFVCCGEEKEVKSIYDCNLVGDYKTVWSILKKVLSFKDMMKNHVTKEQKGEKYFYLKYQQKIGSDCLGCAAVTERVGMKYQNDTLWAHTINGDFAKGFVNTAYHHYNNEISNKPLCKYDTGKHLTDKVADNIYGTREELENWKHFIFNNKLPLFINIVVTDGQDNTSKDFLPWLVDKQYTDDEINKLFGFTEEEIKLIDDTLKKFERNSPWFKRYMCGIENKEIK